MLNQIYCVIHYEGNVPIEVGCVWERVRFKVTAFMVYASAVGEMLNSGVSLVCNFYE